MSTPIAFAPPPGPDPVAGALLTSFPPGRLSEIVGPRSSGGSSLLMTLLARATAEGGLAAMVDLADCLDPGSAREAGVDLQRLVWVRCGGRLAAALGSADLLVRCPGFAMVGVDLGPGPSPRIPHAALVRLQRGVKSGGAVLILRALQHVAGSAASLRPVRSRNARVLDRHPAAHQPRRALVRCAGGQCTGPRYAGARCAKPREVPAGASGAGRSGRGPIGLEHRVFRARVAAGLTGGALRIEGGVRRVACLLVSRFAAAAIIRMEPTLVRQPLVILEDSAPARLVIEATDLAAAQGVRPGMTEGELLAEPRAVICRERSLDAEDSAHRALLEIALTHSPRVEDGGFGLAYLDAAGLRGLFGDEGQIARRLFDGARARGLDARIGIAGSRAGALLAARSAREVAVIPPGGEAAALAPAPLALLDLSQEMADRLARWGLRTLGDLAALPSRGLAERLGQEGPALQRLARGEDQHPLRPHEPVPVVEEAQEMEGAVEALGPVHALLDALVERMCGRLERRHGAADRIEWTCFLAGGAEHAGEVVPAFPTRDPAAIGTLVRAAVDARPPRAPVTGVRVRGWPVHASPAQESLDGPTRPNPRRLAETLARLAALVGAEKVGVPVILDTHRPDAVRLDPFTLHAGFRTSRRRSARTESIGGGAHGTAPGGGPGQAGGGRDEESRWSERDPSCRGRALVAGSPAAASAAARRRHPGRRPSGPSPRRGMRGPHRGERGAVALVRRVVGRVPLGAGRVGCGVAGRHSLPPGHRRPQLVGGGHLRHRPLPLGRGRGEGRAPWTDCFVEARPPPPLPER